MKNSIKVLIGVAMTVIASLAFGNSVPGLKVVVDGDHAFSLEVQATNEAFDIYLLDDNGEVLYSEKISERQGFRKKFDLSHLPKGEYQVKIQDEKKVQLLPIDYRNEAVVVHLDKIEYKYFPVISERQNVITISTLNFSEKPVEVQIENMFGETVYSGKLQGSNYIGKKFDFSKVRGKYTMIVNNGGLVSTKTFDVY